MGSNKAGLLGCTFSHVFLDGMLRLDMKLQNRCKGFALDSQRAALWRLPEEIYAENFEAEFGARDESDDLSDGQEAQNRDGSDTEDTDSMDLRSVSEAGSLERDLGELMDALIAEAQDEEAG